MKRYLMEAAVYAAFTYVFYAMLICAAFVFSGAPVPPARFWSALLDFSTVIGLIVAALYKGLEGLTPALRRALVR